MYDNYVKKLSNKFSNRLRDISADYNFDYGDEFEIAICQVLRDFLPDKFGVCRGFIVDRNGSKVGDDIIIYDKASSPTINLYRDDLSRKENIPVEAVYAYIEAKHTLTLGQFDKSLSQINAIKNMCSKRDKVSLYQNDSYIGSYQDKGNVVESLPKYRNPICTFVLARYAVDQDDNRTDDVSKIESMIASKMKTMSSTELNPEMIILGENNLMCVGYLKDNNSIPTLFYPDNGHVVGYQNLVKPNFAYGIFLTQLMAAVDWIRLGNTPWIEILNEAKST